MEDVVRQLKEGKDNGLWYTVYDTTKIMQEIPLLNSYLVKQVVVVNASIKLDGRS